MPKTQGEGACGQGGPPCGRPRMIVGHRLPQTWSDTTEGVLEGGRKDLEAKGKKVLKVGKYEKFAKTMLNPAANDGLYKKVLGHDLEIVLLTNPADIKAGDDIKAEVLLNGKPVKAPLGLTYDGYSAEQDAYMAKAEPARTHGVVQGDQARPVDAAYRSYRKAHRRERRQAQHARYLCFPVMK